MANTWNSPIPTVIPVGGSLDGFTIGPTGKDGKGWYYIPNASILFWKKSGDADFTQVPGLQAFTLISGDEYSGTTFKLNDLAEINSSSGEITMYVQLRSNSPSASSWATNTPQITFTVGQAVQYDYTFTQGDVDDLTAANLAATIAGKAVAAGVGVNAGDLMVITLNSSVGVINSASIGGNNFTVSNDKKSASINFPAVSGAPVFTYDVKVGDWLIPQWLVDLYTPKGLSLQVNDVSAGVGYPVAVGDSLKYSVPSGWVINEIRWVRQGEPLNFTVSSDKRSATGVNIYDGIEQSLNNTYTFNTVAPAILEWVTKPTGGEPNKDIVFKWRGGSPAATGYQVIITDSGTTTEVDNVRLVNPEYTMNRVAGNYTIQVFDEGILENPTSFISGDVSIAAIPPKYKVTQSDLDILAANGCTMNISGVPAVVGAEAFAGGIIDIAASSKRQIQAASLGAWVFTILDNGKKAEYNIASADAVQTGLVLRTIEIKPEPLAPFNNIYRVTPDIMREVSKQRYVTVGVGGEESTIDYGTAILNVISLPFEINPVFVKPDAKIQLGKLKTTIDAPVISSDVITLDLGSIVVPETYHNALDYVNTTAILHLPRVAPIAVDLEYVIGQTLDIKYDIDVYRGQATVNISSTKIGDVIITKQVDLGINVPYITGMVWTPESSNSGVNIGGDNGVTVPFIEIVRNDSPLVNKMFSIPVVDEDVLGNHTGYIEVQNIDLVTDAIRSEKQEIINQLNSGVIIK